MQSELEAKLSTRTASALTRLLQNDATATATEVLLQQFWQPAASFEEHTVIAGMDDLDSWYNFILLRSVRHGSACLVFDLGDDMFEGIAANRPACGHRWSASHLQ